MTILDLGVELVDLWDSQSEWSQATFGRDSERGPIGALKHLSKEAIEAAENPSDRSEFADCFLLLLDASRRAGIKLGDLVLEAKAKHKINKARTWPTPTLDEPVEHVKS